MIYCYSTKKINYFHKNTSPFVNKFCYKYVGDYVIEGEKL